MVYNIIYDIIYYFIPISWIVICLVCNYDYIFPKFFTRKRKLFFQYINYDKNRLVTSDARKSM